MKIDDDHLYHGAALIQIAESPKFTAINSLKVGKKALGVAYLVNDDVGIYLKYAKVPKKPYSEFVFTFAKNHLDDLAKIATKLDKVFIALVCIEEREICCLSYEQLINLKKAREATTAVAEDSLTVLVTAPANSKLRVYVNAAGKKKTIAGKETLIGRNTFPSILFE